MINQTVVGGIQTQVGSLAAVLGNIYKLLFVFDAYAYGKGLLFELHLSVMEHVICVARAVADGKNRKGRSRFFRSVYDDGLKVTGFVRAYIRHAAVEADRAAESFYF